jgi:hypothetical protein
MAQLFHLRAEGCTEVQGYLFSVPRPACEIDVLLQQGPHGLMLPGPDGAAWPIAKAEQGDAARLLALT